ncbi:hypothetical protein KS4_26900 [Poriferisphaera corsica]|uniref:Uncharacterized protein n=1 Tax=Poriferisphaera corsica TaxID=2528020 RepID=A0A517YWN9_9BACT|nr:SAM-dependent methyltransferase [Poriferisphaera corsica]QDU34619.1 hypothetical protein KS4_26900 [Poriferisphaera corsica]
MAFSDQIKFLAAFIRNPKHVGAIAPSSPALAKAMVDDLQVPDTHTIAEFGPGTGPFTNALSDRFKRENRPAHYLGIERDENFIQILRNRFPDMNFVHGSAEHLPTYHSQSKLPPIGGIVCGLPFASLPIVVQDSITSMLNDLLQPGTVFRTFQYVHAYPLPTAIRFRRRMKNMGLQMQKRKVIFNNIPPAYVLTWTRSGKLAPINTDPQRELAKA